jgi:hypothetical protein
VVTLEDSRAAPFIPRCGYRSHRLEMGMHD